MSYCESFKPSINKQSEILILGSMPGIKSLKTQQYYAYSRNRFWMIMSNICNYQNLINEKYENRLNVLLENKIALWDVIKSCERVGSSDSKIKNPKPNKIDCLLTNYKNINKICLNGSTANKLFNKFFGNIPNVTICPLPSTSPLNTKFTTEEIIKIWETTIKQQ